MDEDKFNHIQQLKQKFKDLNHKKNELKNNKIIDNDKDKDTNIHTKSSNSNQNYATTGTKRTSQIQKELDEKEKIKRKESTYNDKSIDQLRIELNHFDQHEKIQTNNHNNDMEDVDDNQENDQNYKNQNDSEGVDESL